LSSEQQATLESFLPATETSAPITASETTTTTTTTTEKAKKPRKTKPALTQEAEAALLAPAESGVETTTTTTTTAAAATVTAPSAGVVPTHESHLRDHKHRLATINTSCCVGRKIDEENPIVGTRKEDEGSNGLFYPELQCKKKRPAGSLLCDVCSRKEEKAQATPDKTDKTWYGRLDQPLYWNAKVLGCAHFYTKYPLGLLNDPTTCALVTANTIAESAPPKTKAKAAKPKAAAKSAKTDKVVAATSAAESNASIEESVAAEVAPEVIRLITFVESESGKFYVRDSKTGNVYKHGVTAETLEESINSDNFAGLWVDGAIYKEGVEVEDE